MRDGAPQRITLRPRSAFPLLLTFALVAGSPPAFGAGEAPADAQAANWLVRMQRALVELDYRGVFSYYRDGELASLALAHGRVGGVVRERLVHLDGARREIVRDGDRIVCVLDPGDPMLDYAERIPPGPFARAFIPGDGAAGGVLPPSYGARMSGRGRIADIAAVRIDIDPIDDDRFGYRIWLADPSAMPLRAELLSPEGRALEIFQFVRLEIGVELGAADLAPAPGGDRVIHELSFEAPVAGDPQSAPAWEAGWLPEGFQMSAAALRRAPAREAPMHALRYSDGLANLSVFVERTWVDARWTRTRTQGATAAVMRELEVGGGDRYLVTVVGEIPVATAERIAAAVRPRS